MFLAWKEIIYDKKKYALVVGVMFLIAYLVYFLTGLAYGLAMENRLAVDSWQADAIVLTEESNGNLSMSVMEETEGQSVQAEESAPLGQSLAIVSTDGQEQNASASIFAIPADSFLAPEIVEGHLFEGPHQAVVDISLKEEENFHLGDKFQVSGSDQSFEIVGFSQDQKFNVAPVIHISIEAFQDLRYDQLPEEAENRFNAVVVRGTLDDVGEDLEALPIDDFINELPGYSAQVLTFAFMIVFLIIIAAVVIGIFIYVLTIQKQPIFGVMKAQGISNAYVSTSVIYQTLILALIGIALGLGFTLLSAHFLPTTVPFQANYLFFTVISVLIVLCALIGGLFSVRTITQIDPAQAIA